MEVQISAVDEEGRSDPALGPWLRSGGMEDVAHGRSGTLGAAEIITLVISGAGSIASLVTAGAAFARARRRTVTLKRGSTEVQVTGPVDGDELAAIVSRLEGSSD